MTEPAYLAQSSFPSIHLFEIILNEAAIFLSFHDIFIGSRQHGYMLRTKRYLNPGI